EQARVLGQAVGELLPGLDIFTDLLERVSEALFVGLTLQDGEALDHRQAGVDDGRELAREDGDVTDGRNRPEVEPLRKFDISVEALFGSLDLADEVAFLPQR